MKYPIVFLSLLFVAALAAGDTVSLTAEGRLLTGKNHWEFRHAPAWRGVLLRDATVRHHGGRSEVTGTCAVSPELNVSLSAQLDGNRYVAELAADGPTDRLTLELKLPADLPADLEIGGKLLALSGEQRKASLLNAPQPQKGNSFSFVSGNRKYTLRGEFGVTVSDLRGSTKENLYCIHLHPPKADGGRRCRLEFAIESEPLESRSIDLRGAANMGFRDDVANDGHGGWTDQGPENDLSCFPAGKLECAGISFEIPALSGDSAKGALVLSKDRNFPPIRPLRFAGTTPCRYVYLLHAAAWVPAAGVPVGFIEAGYADGSTARIPAVAGVDCGNWWRPALSFRNGRIGWTGSNRSGEVGLYVSAFRLDGKPLRQLRFLPGDGVWMIAGVTLANLRLPGNAVQPTVIRAGSEWKELKLPVRIRPGSPLDFSGLRRNAGKQPGQITAALDGHFAPEDNPGERIRFFGTNLCQELLVPAYEDAELLAENLAAAGYNSVRLHQFEKFIMDWNASDTRSFNPESLDRFFHLYAKLREKGMYITTDIYATRPIRPGDGIAECRNSTRDDLRKFLNFFSETALDDWKEYARRLFTLRNPYTGLSMAEDPALFAVNLDNESPLYHVWKSAPEFMPLVEAAYEEWLKQRNLHTPEFVKERGRTFHRFLAERQSTVMAEQARFLREELGMKALITNLNNNASPSLQPFRNTLDLVDVHIYHDHPSYPMNNWKPPVKMTQTSDISGMAGSMRGSMPVRIPGKPLIATEINYCYPNRFRSEAGALIGAYAALQGWDGLYRFCHGFRRNEITGQTVPGAFNTIHDPVGILTERIIFFLFGRGDVSAAGEMLCYLWDDEQYGERFPREFALLGLFTGIGSTPKNAVPTGCTGIDTGRAGWRDHLPEAAQAALDQMETHTVAKSSTGEIMLDAKAKQLRVVTPKSEVLTFDGTAARGRFLRAHGADGFCTVSVHSLDGRPLAESQEMLLFHLTDSLADNTRFLSPDRTLVDNYGRFPLLLRRGRVEVALDVTGDNWEVHALDLGGNTQGAIPARQMSGALRFIADTHGPAGTTMVYHLKRR